MRKSFAVIIAMLLVAIYTHATAATTDREGKPKDQISKDHPLTPASSDPQC